MNINLFADVSQLFGGGTPSSRGTIFLGLSFPPSLTPLLHTMTSGVLCFWSHLNCARFWRCFFHVSPDTSPPFSATFSKIQRAATYGQACKCICVLLLRRSSSFSPPDLLMRFAFFAKHYLRATLLDVKEAGGDPCHTMLSHSLCPFFMFPFFVLPTSAVIIDGSYHGELRDLCQGHDSAVSSRACPIFRAHPPYR